MLQVKLSELANSFFSELTRKFPDVFTNTDSKNEFTYRKKNILLRCQQAINGEDLSEKINHSNKEAVKYINIPDFVNSKEHEKIIYNFNKARMYIQRLHHADVRNFTVDDFYFEYQNLVKNND